MISSSSIFIFIFHCILVIVSNAVDLSNSDHQHVYTDSFSRNDEFDMMALDPSTPYGTPYGGFSRATASRLASLPLTLPSIGKEIDSDEFEPTYTTVRDMYGRPFVCRVYHEDELELTSLGDSMFDTPRLKHKIGATASTDKLNNSDDEKILDDTATTTNRNDGEGATVTSSTSATTELEREIMATNTDNNNNDDESVVNETKDNNKQTNTLASELNPIMLGHEIHQRFSKLVGLCAQLHPGWWSYEWCYQEKVTQFHVSINSNKQVGSNNKVEDFKLEDVTSLGSYSGRKMELSSEEGEDNNHQNNEYDNTVNDNDTTQPVDFAQERKELGRVVDTFIGGDMCPDTGKPRVTEATFRCCSQQYLTRTKGGILKNGRPIETDIVTIIEATEWKESTCHYNITLCTPLLCDDYIDEADSSVDDDESGSSKMHSNSQKGNNKSIDDKKNSINLNLDPIMAEKMSVVEILEKTFGTDGDFCIRSAVGGWWQYEVCPGNHVRQYHETEVSAVERITGRGSHKSKVDTEHYLGRFVPVEHKTVTKENEWENVVNATTISGSGNLGLKPLNKKKSLMITTRANGNGSYYYQEYTKGDVCDHEDVTDSAIKAGEFGEGGIERATTVRYSCNSKLDISVKEDSTCHYIVEISVPTLCYHPLFKAPVAKKQVVKCLPLTPS